jgi:predicted permease
VDWPSRIRAVFAGSAQVPDDDVIEELAEHARAMYEAMRADGLSGEACAERMSEQLDLWRAEGAALRRPRGRRPAPDPPPAAASSRVAEWAQEVRYAARVLRRQPHYTLLAGATMALGIAATTLLFSLTYGVLLKPMPWPRSDRLLALSEMRGGRAPRFGSFSNAAYLAWRGAATTVDDVAAWSERTATVGGPGEPERIRVTAASASLFPVLGLRPLIGSFFGETDEVSAEGAVVVLSEGLWRGRFGGDPGVVGRLIPIDGQPYRVVGVLPEALAYPDHRTRAWIPFRVPPPTGNLLSMFGAVARLRPGATAAQAASEATRCGRFAVDTGMTTMAIFGGRGPIEVTAVPLRDALTADVRRPLVVLLCATGLLLATATANVAGLQLARATTRRRELAIRAALGAGGGRLVRQLLVESLLLGLFGGGSGLALAALLHRPASSLLPADFPRLADLHLDATVVFFALAASVLTSIAFGVLPAWQARRLDLVRSLAEDGTAPVGTSCRSPTARARMVIMAGQVALASVLLIAAALLGRSFAALLTADRGYDPAGVLTARVPLPPSLYTPPRRSFLLGQILGRLRTMPGVAAAGFTSEFPLTPGGSTGSFEMRSPRGEGGAITAQASPRLVSPGYFAALRLRILGGRGFTEEDTATSAPVAIVNRAFAQRYLGGTALEAKLPMALGHGGEDREATIVGVVDDVRYVTAHARSQPEIYYSYRQLGSGLDAAVVTLLVRAVGEPTGLAPALRTAVHGADPGLAPDLVMTMEDRVVTSLARPRLYAVVLGAFAFAALMVVTVGLFSVLSYTVAQRSRELAVRSALGARPVDLVRLVVGQGLAVTGAGLGLGLAASVALSRSMGALLYGVTPADIPTHAGVILTVASLAAAACAVPARRAARLEPARALRSP